MNNILLSLRLSLSSKQFTFNLIYFNLIYQAASQVCRTYEPVHIVVHSYTLCHLSPGSSMVKAITGDTKVAGSILVRGSETFF